MEDHLASFEHVGSKRLAVHIHIYICDLIKNEYTILFYRH